MKFKNFSKKFIFQRFFLILGCSILLVHILLNDFSLLFKLEGMIIVPCVLICSYIDFKKELYEERIKEYCQKYGLTADDVGEITGFSIDSFYYDQAGKIMFIAGSYKNKRAILNRLADYFDVENRNL